MLIGSILAETATKFPDKLAIICGEDSLTYAELENASNCLANALIREDLAKGHNIAIYSANQTEYPSIFFGSAKSGGVLAHMSARFSSEELISVVNKTEIEALFVHSALADNVLSSRDKLPNLKRVIVFGAGVQAKDGAETLDQFLGGAENSSPQVDMKETDPFGITYTGGTTGFPKGVVVSHEARVIGSIRAAREMEIALTDIMCCSSPFFHIAGLFIWYQTGVMMGLTSVIMPAWDPIEFMDLVEKHKITAAFMVPTQINSVISHEALDQGRLKTLRYVNYGAAPTSLAQLKKQIASLPDVIWQEQYGQSEAGNLTVRSPEYNLSKSGSVGRPYSDLEMAVFDRNDQPLPTGEAGEVVTRGRQVMLGYYKERDQTKEVFTRDGWIRTGDVGYFDDDGFLFLVDRSKDMIISGGENIFPTEIEEALYGHEAVNECAVFGVPDDHWGEVPAAHVVLEEGSSLGEDDLVEFCTKVMARHKRPRLIKFVTSLPKSAVGKIQKNIIREPYWVQRDKNI